MSRKTFDSNPCSLAYVSGYRRGDPCPYAASEVIVLQYDTPFLVCGYHARAYGPSVRYSLTWSLEEVRRWRLGNLDELVSRLAGDKAEAPPARICVKPVNHQGVHRDSIGNEWSWFETTGHQSPATGAGDKAEAPE